MLVRRLARTSDVVTLELIESTDEADLLPRLARGELDFAFVLMPVEDETLEAVKLLRDPYYLVGPIESPYGLDIDSLDELAGVPIVAPRTCRGWTLVAEQLDAAGVSPSYAFRTDDDFAIKGLIQSGLGIALVSKLTRGMMGGRACQRADLRPDPSAAHRPRLGALAHAPPAPRARPLACARCLRDDRSRRTRSRLRGEPPANRSRVG
jgi:DNA-binding transcriptional LysR family regulator